MVLEHLDGPFGSVGAMQVGQGKLEGDSFFSHEGLESYRAFIVKRLKNGSQASVGELGVEGGVGLHEFMLAVGFQWLWYYGIAVIIVQDHDVFSATT